MTRDDLQSAILRALEQSGPSIFTMRDAITDLVWPVVETLNRIDMGESQVRGLQPWFYGHAMTIARNALRVLEQAKR